MRDMDAFARAFLRRQQAIEAAASVSLSHPEDCPCMVCRAAHGDEEALGEIIAMLERET